MYWIWPGDGDDIDLQAVAVPVVIQPQELRSILQEREDLLAVLRQLLLLGYDAKADEEEDEEALFVWNTAKSLMAKQGR